MRRLGFRVRGFSFLNVRELHPAGGFIFGFRFRIWGVAVRGLGLGGVKASKFRAIPTYPAVPSRC